MRGRAVVVGEQGQPDAVATRQCLERIDHRHRSPIQALVVALELVADRQASKGDRGPSDKPALKLVFTYGGELLPLVTLLAGDIIVLEQRVIAVSILAVIAFASYDRGCAPDIISSNLRMFMPCN
jgi:hypothetical protein